MKITSLLTKENIQLGLAPTDKEELLAGMVKNLAESGAVEDAQRCLDAVLVREAQCSTAVGHGIGIPHCKGNGVLRTALCAAVVPEGMSFGEPDGQPVRLFFLIVTPDGADDTHVHVLCQLSRLLLLEGIVDTLCAAPDAETFLQYVEEGEAKLTEGEREKSAPEEEVSTEKAPYTVLAVTGCPTGIAHTYMAAQALEQAATELGISAKVETNGAAGVRNPLTEKEIAGCEGILVASDRPVEMTRFAGKPVLQVSVKKAILHPADLLQQVAAGDAPIYHTDDTAETAKREVASEEHTGLFWTGYHHIMNGISQILPLLMAAGVLGTLAGFLPEAAGMVVYQLGMCAHALVLIVLSGYIARSIGGDPALVVGLTTGMLAESGASLAGWGMPGFVGGVLAGFVSGGVVLLLRKLLRHVPETFTSFKLLLLYPVLGVLVSGLAMLVLNIPATFVFGGLFQLWKEMPLWAATLIAVGMGCMMAIDLGGPINKLAYGLAILLLTAQITGPMAAVMAAGMVPPLAVGISALLFRSRFTAEERTGGWRTLLLGLDFVSEAAMPLAFRAPHATKPAFLLGGMTAAGLSLWLGCGSSVPHGGVFVVPLMQNPLGWLAALLLGTLVSVIVLRMRLEVLPAPADTAEETEEP